MRCRTLNLPDSVEALACKHAHEGGSFSSAAARLIRIGTVATGRATPPQYVASGDGPRDLGHLAERYLRESIDTERRSSKRQVPSSRS